MQGRLAVFVRFDIVRAKGIENAGGVLDMAERSLYRQNNFLVF
jgi:hypothetical protein